MATAPDKTADKKHHKLDTKLQVYSPPRQSKLLEKIHKREASNSPARTGEEVKNDL